MGSDRFIAWMHNEQNPYTEVISMARRNKILRKSLRYLQNPSGSTQNEPPAGSILANYKNYVAGVSLPNYPRPEASKPGELLDVAINPFFSPLGTADENKIAVKLSKRSNDATGVDSVQVACNIDASVPAGVLPNRDFDPAKVTVFVAGATPTTSLETSQITGIQYRAVNGDSYTFPYGQATGELYEQDVRATILTAIQGIAGARGSFTPERLI